MEFKQLLHPRIISHWLPAIFLFGLTSLRAEKLTVAGATNLACALDALDAAYHQANPGDNVTSVIGPSENLLARIKQGDPVDVFLSADTDCPKKLAVAGDADPATLTTFATGHLALWTMNPDIDVSDVAKALEDPRVKRVAIAAPGTTSYGEAAKESLLELEIWRRIQPKLVMGDSLAQTEQIVATGNADVGFVALSLMFSPKNKGRGTYHEVPPELYEPLDQGAVITKRGTANPAAKRYLAFLKTRTAQDIFKSFGYDVPWEP